jgi:hypothetical protein
MKDSLNSLNLMDEISVTSDNSSSINNLNMMATTSDSSSDNSSNIIVKKKIKRKSSKKMDKKVSSNKVKKIPLSIEQLKAKRRRQNREAAQRARERKAAKVRALEEKIKHLECENQQLRLELQQYKVGNADVNIESNKNNDNQSYKTEFDNNSFYNHNDPFKSLPQIDMLYSDETFNPARLKYFCLKGFHLTGIHY